MNFPNFKADFTEHGSFLEICLGRFTNHYMADLK